jgi:hypothetical protein
MPLISRIVVGSFNGGTVTNPITIDLSGDLADRTALDVIEPATFGFSVRPFRFRQTDFNYLQMETTGVVSTAGNDFTTAGANVAALGITASSKLELNDSNVVFALLDLLRGFVTAFHAAPADADVADGSLALWFDQAAPGALKIKARDSGGTLRTATIALT